MQFTTIIVMALAAIAGVSAAAVPINSGAVGREDESAHPGLTGWNVILDDPAVDFNTPSILKNRDVDSLPAGWKTIVVDRDVNSQKLVEKAITEAHSADSTADPKTEHVRKLLATADGHPSRGGKKPEHWYDCLACGLGMFDGNFFYYSCSRCQGG